MSRTLQTENQSNVVRTTGQRAQLGALDLGSNSFHLLIAQESGGRIQILDKHKEMVRLASGLDRNDQLSDAAIARALDCLTRFAQRLRPLKRSNVRIVGTNTLRQVKGKAFQQAAQRVLGHKIDIISGREEARLIYLGVCHDLGASKTKRLVVDIGGGSTELILGRKTTPTTLDSLYMGCVSMTNECFENGKITRTNMARAINTARVELEPIMAQYVSIGWQEAIGTSGTINSIQAAIKGISKQDEITAVGLRKLQDFVLAEKRIDDLRLPGLTEERRPVFVGGLAILIAVFEALEIESMTTSQCALREGLIFDLIGRQHQDDARDHSANNLMERFGVDQSHARQVRETAIDLLSQLATQWDLTSAEAKHLISWAADLHEIGMDLSHAGYHKHGAYMIENIDLPGFSRSDQQQLAILVRNHRRKLLNDMFPTSDPTQIRLAVILRISALLHRNRSHESLPHIAVSISTDGDSQQLVLTLPKKWLYQNPLTALDLEQEAQYLKSAGITFTVKTT